MNTTNFLTECSVAPEVFALRPDYKALLITVTGLEPNSYGAHTSNVSVLITQAEKHARQLLAENPVENIPHIATWRDAYRAFGAKPQRTRNSLEALTRRAEAGLPRVGTLTDIYNAISVLHQIPLGGEDLDRYRGPAKLIRAAGTEPFHTVANGEPNTETPEPGEVIWTTGGEVTCRRWNWRQGTTTALSETTRNALFICDVLSPVSDTALAAAAQALAEALIPLGTDVQIRQRIIAAE